MMRKTGGRFSFILSILVTCMSLVPSDLYAQDYHTQFLEAFESEDSLKQIQVLLDWETHDPQNAELYVCFFNYYVNYSRQEMLVIGNNPSGEALTIEDTATGVTVGYLYSEWVYDNDFLDKGFEKIQKGIDLHPNRLDMRFGKTYVYGEIEDYESFTDEIIRIVEYSYLNKNQWLWSNGDGVDDPEVFLLSNIQDYQQTLYNTGNDSLLFNMRKIALKILEYYPDHIESLSNAAITYIIFGDYPKAIDLLNQAVAVDDEDAIVLSNLAYAYKMNGDSEKAITFYKKTMEFADPDLRKFAEEMIDEINK